MNRCPFCNTSIDLTQVILENSHCQFIQKPQEVLIGSGLIIPKAHRETVFDLTKEEWMSMYNLLQDAKRYIDNKFQPSGYNIGWNVGSIGGQEIFHAHLHIIPRYSDEPLAGKGIRHWIKQPINQRKNQVKEGDEHEMSKLS
jgi:diadenosine tetraphosphate (Ap4A) HIT family hydrolase